VRYRSTAKRACEIVAAITALILFSPTFLLVSLAIKMDSRGPVFRRETKFDSDGSEFLVLKFRFTEITGNARGSSRMTRVGYVLQGSGIDELPQLVSVLLGEMPIFSSRSRILSFFRRIEW
jgi:lipopolysaccharide/colanic/teichoic acid biosynthesis glycosyltransferase